MARVEAVLTEIKAAAIDVVAESGEQRGLPVVFVDNVPDGGAARRLRASWPGWCRRAGAS